MIKFSFEEKVVKDATWTIISRGKEGTCAVLAKCVEQQNSSQDWNGNLV